MVIINHTNGFILDNKNFINSTFYCICFSLCKIGVPLFLMITGSLILDKSYSYKKILNCIFRVLVPVVGLSLIFYIKDFGIENFNIALFIKDIINEPYTTEYWYIYALIGIYMTIPFLQKMVKSFENKDYILFSILFLIIPSLIDSMKPYFNIDINYNLITAFFPLIISLVVCGNYISKVQLSKKFFIISIFTFLISYILMFSSMYIPYLKNSTISYALDSWNAFPVIIMSISFFYIVRYLFENLSMHHKINNIICIIASTTFGIYLIHNALNYRLYKLNITQSIFSYNSILGSIFLNFLVFIICMIIIYLLKKIPVIRRFL